MPTDRPTFGSAKIELNGAGDVPMTCRPFEALLSMTQQLRPHASVLFLMPPGARAH